MDEKTANVTLKETDDQSRKVIRKAEITDISRISEIYVFNNRQVYYPVFHNIKFSFAELQVLSFAKELERERLQETFVYDDGIVKGFVTVHDHEIEKLHVESFFRRSRIGSALLRYALSHCSATFLWVLKKNENAIAFYKKNGFVFSSEEQLLEGVNGHTEPIVKMVLKDGETHYDL